MSYLDELKKKGQQFVQNVQKAADTANNVYNAAKQGAQNAYNAATGNTQQKPQTQAPNTQPSPAAQPQNAQPAQAQPEVDWAAEYDKAMAPQTTPTTGSQPGGQAAQPPTSAAAQSALGEGAGQWQAELDNVMAQIMGKGKFEYDMNGDAMYQQYADIYQNQANLGMQNAMAQAAALTGGYGSSYAQQVGQQAYAQQMQGLNEIGLDLYDRAYAQDQAERSQLMDQYNMLAAREEQAYNRGIDDRNFEYQQGRDETADRQWQQSFDYNKYLDELEQKNFDKQFDYQKDRDTVADEQWKAGMDQQAKEFDSLYGYTDENGNHVEGYYDRTREDEQAYQQGIHNDLYGYTDEKGEYHEGYYEKEANKDREQDQNQFNAMYGYTDENGVYHEGYNDRAREDEQKFEQGIHDALYGYTDENGNHVAGYYEEEADKERQQDQNQFNSLYGYTDENGEKVSGYYEEMADKEFNQMYGPEGYMTKKDEQDQKNWDAQFKREGEQWNELYGEGGYYDKQAAADRKNKAETASNSSGETAATRAGVSRIDSKLARVKQQGHNEGSPEYIDAIEGEIASLLESDRISEAEANYLIIYYGLDEIDD